MEIYSRLFFGIMDSSRLAYNGERGVRSNLHSADARTRASIKKPSASICIRARGALFIIKRWGEAREMNTLISGNRERARR